MTRRFRKPDTPAHTRVLRLSRRELRQLDAAQRGRQPRPSVLRRFLQDASQGRAAARLRPTRRGWAIPGAGREPYIEPAPEGQGTTVQVCGLWPFIAGSGNPVRGVPLGPNLLNGSTVCADPVHWFLAGLVLNPSCFVLGRPGLGKSSLVRRMVTVLQGWGIVPMVLSDTKPDYVDLIRALNGQVITLGPGYGSINPLDLGPLVAQLEQIPAEDVRRRALEEMRARRRTTVLGLLDLVRGERLRDYEQSLVAEALRVLDEEHPGVPVVDDLLELVRSRHERLVRVASSRGDVAHYDERVQHLLDALLALGPSGPFGETFSRPTSEHIELGRPMVYDLHAIDSGDRQLLAAVQAVCWSHGSALVSADKHLAEAGLRAQRHYFLVMDELWRMLRASGLMVYFLDELTRLNRQRGIGQAMITHTMNDLKLGDAHLTEIAWGFVERSAMVFLGGLANAEMGNLREVFAMSSREVAQIEDWSVEAQVNPDTGAAAAPPGRGKFLLKTGKKAGVPFVMRMVPAELDVNNTNRAWEAAIERAARAGVLDLEDVEDAADVGAGVAV
ncbi:hypothetical protein [Puerhibacterium puerhi]|uniref:hypothetical protein n=1 Tax=Puerhibacterium puerhi TaxID=2692623 RepID=UPI001915DAAB|nr:hypothetical protein [Puerhibacterium puerhi]